MACLSIACTLVAIFALGESSRLSNVDESGNDGKDKFVKCNAEGADVGMSITWGVPKSQCMAKCGPTRNDAWTYEQEFTRAFNVTFDKACECFAGGRKFVQFRPVNKAQALMCSVGTSWKIKVECWKAYQKARGTRFIQHGSRSVPLYTPPFAPSNFVVTRRCSEKCEEENCNKVTMPGALDGMSTKDKAQLGRAVRDIMDGKTDSVSDALQELIAVLPENDLDDAEFTAVDTDGDGKLSVDELADFYITFTVDQIGKFVTDVDANSNREIDPAEFQAFKEAMRNFDPNVDLVSGDAHSLVLNGKVVVDNIPKWKAVVVQCMKNGKPAPGECEGTAEEAMMRFDMDC
eukprot:TRINITY_DN18772_c0_g1_i1.p1 TRINITY_DN18772_c0_g1~~TRINITY_DN18772_c0_g1_i1.p1  ORF type:complete len:347 (-),score=62.57 TRINITY_DN18772_c0_g1_i1:53-1093(-)